MCVCGCTSGITIPAHYPTFVCLFRKEEALPMKSIGHKKCNFCRQCSFTVLHALVHTRRRNVHLASTTKTRKSVS